ESFNLNLESDFINTIFSGVLIGIGTGFVISARSTLGGTSVIAKIINKYSEIKTSQALFILDSLIVLSFLLVLPIQNVLYTIVIFFFFIFFFFFFIFFFYFYNFFFLHFLYYLSFKKECFLI